MNNPAVDILITSQNTLRSPEGIKHCRRDKANRKGTDRKNHRKLNVNDD